MKGLVMMLKLMRRMTSTMIGHDGSDNRSRYQTLVDGGDEDDDDDDVDAADDDDVDDE